MLARADSPVRKQYSRTRQVVTGTFISDCSQKLGVVEILWFSMWVWDVAYMLKGLWLDVCEHGLC